MPPEPTWFTGREPIGRFLATRVLTEPGRFRMIRTRPTASLRWRPTCATPTANTGRTRSACSPSPRPRVARVTSFNDPGLFAAFGLPQAVPAVAAPVPA